MEKLDLANLSAIINFKLALCMHDSTPVLKFLMYTLKELWLTLKMLQEFLFSALGTKVTYVDIDR